MATRRTWIGLAVLALPCLVVTMDLTVLFLAVPQLTADLDPSGTELLWMTDAYGFLIAGALIVFGALGDRLGRRRVLLAGAAGFGAASVLAAAAPSPEVLIAARGLQGVAGAALLPSIMALVHAMFTDDKQRTAALGAVMGCFALGAALGPLVGGGLLELFDWRAVFVPNVPVMLALLVAGPRLVPEFRGAAAGRVDVASGVLSVAGILAVVYGLKGWAADGLGAGAVLAVAGGGLLVAAFVARQRRLEDPLVDVGLFRRPSFSTALAATMLGMFVTYGTFFLTAQFLQLVAGLSPLEAGLWGLPSVVVMGVLSGVVVPRLAAAHGPARLLAGGMLVSAAGLALLTQVGPGTSPAELTGVIVLIVAGLAPTTTIGITLIVGAAPPEQAGAVSGLGQAGNELGGALGIAVLGSLSAAVFRGDLGAGAPDTLAAAAGGPAFDAAAVAFVHGLHVVAVAAAGVLLAMALATAVVLREAPVPAPQPA